MFKSKSKLNFNSFKSIPLSYKILGVVCSVVITFSAVYLFVHAGNIDSPALPSNDSGRMYTLEQIYQQIYTGTAATKQSGGFTEPGSAPGSTMHTLDNIYGDFTTDATATNGTIAANVLSGKTFFATSGTTRGTNWGPVAGTMADNGSFILTCDATDQSVTAGYYSGGTLAGDVNLVTGNIKSGATIFGVAGSTKVLDTTTGTAANGDCLSGKIAFSNGSQITGSITTNTLSDVNDTVGAGYYAATTLSTVDNDLAVGNIKKDVNVFGKVGTLSPSGSAVATDCLDTKTFYSGDSWVQKTGSIANCSSEGGNTCYAASGYWTATAGSNVSVTSSTPASIPTGYYSGKTCSAALTGGTGSLASATEIITGYHAYDNTGAVIQGSATAGSSYTWTKALAGSWVGLNENLDWAIEIGAASWWSSATTYTYCATATACTTTSDGATLKAAAAYTGPPGGWNGSNDYTYFAQSALQVYVVVGADSTNLVDCFADKGDLVFPDGSVWDKSAANAYSTTLTGCDVNDGNAVAIWLAASGGAVKQYGYARNAPSALSIGDAWDGIKDLVSGGNATHTFTNDGTMNDYYDIPSTSWYLAGGTSRLPMILEYEKARQGTVGGGTSLLYGTNAWTNALYLWSAEPYPYGTSAARTFNPSYGLASASDVNTQSRPLWVVVAQ